MTLQSWLPTLSHRRREDDGPFGELQRQMDTLFDDWARGFRSPMLAREQSALLTPSVDVSETNDAYKVMVELPGVEEKDIDVSVDDNRLTIKGEKRRESEEKNGQYHRIERSYGTFQRTMALPPGVDAEKVAAEAKNGTLTITLPKSPDMQTKTRKVEIKHAT